MPEPLEEKPPQEERGGKNSLVCQFCFCKITPANGDVLKMSPEAKAFRDADETIEALKKQLEKAKTDLEEEKAKHATPTPKKDSPATESKPTKKLFWFQKGET